MTIVAIIISITSLLCSVAIPVITAFINNSHNKKMWFLENYEKHRYEVIEQYLHTMARFIFSPNPITEQDYAEAVSEIFMYTPKSKWPKIESLNNSLRNLLFSMENNQSMQDSLISMYFDLCKDFSDLPRKEALNEDKNRKNSNKKWNKKPTKNTNKQTSIKW